MCMHTLAAAHTISHDIHNCFTLHASSILGRGGRRGVLYLSPFHTVSHFVASGLRITSLAACGSSIWAGTEGGQLLLIHLPT